MKNVAFIPVRGGSKSIPLKNIKYINGMPLVYWVIKAAYECKDIDWIYVATDSEIIKNTVEKLEFTNLSVVGRSEDSASDTATTEKSMLEFANTYTFENIVLIQATSPLLSGENLAEGFQAFNEYGVNSVMSVVRQKRFIWSLDEKGLGQPVNYDVFARPRRQEFSGYLVENGAFYITSRESLLRTKNRVWGNIKLVEMPEYTFFEIDEPSDWIIVEKLMQNLRIKKNYKLSNMRMFLTDCDGCLTDGGMYYSETGDEMKKFNTKDGMGFELLKEKGVITGIITGEDTQIVKKRADKLHIDILKMGVKDKLEVIQELCQAYEISKEQIVYIGDDKNDLEVIRSVGFGCSVKNGHPEVRNSAAYVTQAEGGQGAVREVADLLLRECYGRN